MWESAYSCLTVLKDGQVACLYERGDKDSYGRITFVRFGAGLADGREVTWG